MILRQKSNSLVVINKNKSSVRKYTEDEVPTPGVFIQIITILGSIGNDANCWRYDGLFSITKSRRL